MQRDRRGTVLLRDAVASVAVRGVVVAEGAADHPALFEVGGAALACVAAHAVFSAAGLQDGLPGEGLPVLHIHKQPEEDRRAQILFSLYLAYQRLTDSKHAISFEVVFFTCICLLVL